MNDRSIILFTSHEPTESHAVIRVVGTQGEHYIYVRAVIFAGDVAAAFNKASSFQRPGETVLNTIPLFAE